MQRKNSGPLGSKYKPCGLGRFVCGISVLLLLLHVRAVGQQTLAVFVYRRPRRPGIMMRASPGDRGLGELLEKSDLEVRVDYDPGSFSYNANSGALSLAGGRMEEGRRSVEITAADPSDP